VKILALDPSSVCVGYAVLKGLRPDELLEAGRLRPGVGVSTNPAAGMKAWCRIERIGCELSELLGTWGFVGAAATLETARIVIEVPSGRCGTGSRRGASSSLAVYGLAAGYVAGLCEAAMPGGVRPVTEREWTPRTGGKDRRKIVVAALYKGRYQPKRDPGGDVADAVLLGRWWWMRFKRKELGAWHSRS